VFTLRTFARKFSSIDFFLSFGEGYNRTEQKTSKQVYCRCLECSKQELRQLPLRLVQTSCEVRKLWYTLWKIAKNQEKKTIILQLLKLVIAKYRDLPVASKWITCQSRELSKSRNFAIIKFNNCFIIPWPRFSSYFFKALFWQLHFSQKGAVTITHKEIIIRSKACSDNTSFEQTIICRQLLIGHVVGSQPMKEKKNASNDKYFYLYEDE